MEIFIIVQVSVEKSLNPYPRILEKKSKNREMSKRHFWKKNPSKIPKIAFWEMSKRHFWKKNPDFVPVYMVMNFSKIIFSGNG